MTTMRLRDHFCSYALKEASIYLRFSASVVPILYNRQCCRSSLLAPTQERKVSTTESTTSYTMLRMLIYAVIFASTTRGAPVDSRPSIDSPGFIGTGAPPQPPACWNAYIRRGHTQNDAFLDRRTASSSDIRIPRDLPSTLELFTRNRHGLPSHALTFLRQILGEHELQYHQYRLRYTEADPATFHKYKCAIHVGLGLLAVQSDIPTVWDGWTFPDIAWYLWRNAVQSTHGHEWRDYISNLNYLYQQNVVGRNARQVLLWALEQNIDDDDRASDHRVVSFTEIDPGPNMEFWAILGTDFGVQSLALLTDFKRVLAARNILRIYVVSHASERETSLSILIQLENLNCDH